MSGSWGRNEGFRLLKWRNNRLNLDPVRCYTVLTKVRTKENTADSIECSSCSLDSSTPLTSPVDTSPHSSLRTGWAVSKPRGSVRFSEKVKEYLTARFTLGERTGRKADPAQVAVDMRNAKNESNARLFTREQWLTKSQVQSFFSRLASMRRRDQGVIGISLDEEEDIQCVQENSER